MHFQVTSTPTNGCYTSTEHGAPRERIIADKTGQDKCGHALHMLLTHSSTSMQMG